MNENIVDESNIGLVGGIAGKVFTDFLLVHENGDIDMRRNAESQLDIIGEGILRMDDFSFEKGISGIGWMIEYFAQNQLLAINSDEILEEVDDNIYKYTLNCVAKSEIDILEALGLVNYHQIRRKSQNAESHFYRKFIHSECLRLLSDKLNTYLLSKIVELEEGKELALNDLGIMTKVVGNFSYLMISIMNEKLLQESFYKAVELLIIYYQRFIDKINGSDQKVLPYCENCLLLLLAVKQYDNPYWIEKVEELYFALKGKLSVEQFTDSLYYQKLMSIEEVYIDSAFDNNRLIELIETAPELLVFYLNNYKLFTINGS